MIKHNREAEVLDLIKTHGPITSKDIAFRLGMSTASVSFYTSGLKGKIHVGDMDETRSISGKRILSSMWAAGPGTDVTKAKSKRGATKTAPHAPVMLDLAQMPYRSVFAGGVSPWVGVSA